MKSLLLPVSLLFGLTLWSSCTSESTEQQAEQPQVRLVEQEVQYTADSVTMNGYLVYDSAATGQRPGVLVVHEWWGHNDHARKAARKLAEAGFAALALDMYGDGKQAAHPEDAGAFAMAVMSDPAGVEARFGAGLEYLINNAPVNPEHLGAIGYCFGGGVVLNMARAGMPLDAVVSLHGSLQGGLTAEPGKVKARMLVLNGESDPFVPAESRAAFRTEMDSAGVDYQVINYPGVVHGFTNPAATDLGTKFGLPLAYNAQADSLSWQETIRFLNESFAR